MSGVKCGQIQLADRVRVAISATFAASAAATSVLASGAALEAELADALSGAEHFLTAGVGKEHRAILESFVEQVATLRTALADLRDRQLEIEARRQSEPAMTEDTLAEMSRLESACQAVIRQINGLDGALRAKLGDVDAVLRRERRGEAYMANIRTRTLRGILADIDTRMQSVRPGGLRAVTEAAARLRSDIAARITAGGTDEAGIRDFRQELDRLVHAASTLDERVQKQRVAHHRLMMTLEEFEYRKVNGTEIIPDDYRSPARSTHVIDEQQVMTQTEVHLSGELRLTMLGPGADGMEVRTCAKEGCDNDLRALMEAGKRNGITFEVVPIPGGGVTEDEEEEQGAIGIARENP